VGVTRILVMFAIPLFKGLNGVNAPNNTPFIEGIMSHGHSVLV
jgi:hypothetical protein